MKYLTIKFESLRHEVSGLGVKYNGSVLQRENITPRMDETFPWNRIIIFFAILCMKFTLEMGIQPLKPGANLIFVFSSDGIQSGYGKFMEIKSASSAKNRWISTRKDASKRIVSVNHHLAKHQCQH